MLRFKMLALIIFISAITNVYGQDKRANTIDGKVKSIDAKKKEVTIIRGNGKETTVKFDDNSEIRLDGKLAKFDSIKLKQEVRCVYEIESKTAHWFGIYVDVDRPPMK